MVSPIVSGLMNPFIQTPRETDEDPMIVPFAENSNDLKKTKLKFFCMIRLFFEFGILNRAPATITLP